jgi:hypothetical protein
MMQLISRKALETDQSHAGTTGIPITLEEVPSKDPTYSTKINCRAAHQAKDHGEEALDGRALRVYHVDGTITGVNFVECAGGKIIIMSCLIRSLTDL